MSVREGDPHGWHERLRRLQAAQSCRDWKKEREDLWPCEVLVVELAERSAVLELRSHTLTTGLEPARFPLKAIHQPDVDLVEGEVVTVKIYGWALKDRGWPTGSGR